MNIIQKSSSLLVFLILVHMKHFHFLSSLEIVLLAWLQDINGIIHFLMFDCAGVGAQAFSCADSLSPSTVISQQQCTAISLEAVPLAETFCSMLLREQQFSFVALGGVITSCKSAALCLVSKIIAGGCYIFKFTVTM